jgi:hypothetical protein
MNGGRDEAGTREVTDYEFDFRLTRRTVLAGGTALAVSTAAKAGSAPTKNINLDFLDKTRRQVVVLTDVSAEQRDPRDKRANLDVIPDESARAAQSVVTKPSDPKFLLSWDRREFGPNALFKIERTSAEYFPNGKPDPNKPNDEARTAVWLPVTWTLHINHASFPGAEGKEFSAVFAFCRETVFDHWTVSASITDWWGTKSRLIKTLPPHIDLENFINKAGKCRLDFKIDGSDANGLLRSLFGERIEASVPLVLSMDSNLGWAIDADLRPPMPVAVKADPAGEVKRTGRLFILDIPLEFGGVTLTRIRSDLADTKEQQAGATVGETQVSTPNAPTDEDKRLFEAEVIYGQPSKLPKDRPDGLYGVIRDMSGFTAPNKNAHDREDVVQIWSFDFARKRVVGSDAAVNFAINKAEIEFGDVTGGQKRIAKAAAAIRHWGFPDHTVAGCLVRPVNEFRSLGRLRIRHDSPGAHIEEGPFEFSGFEIVRQYRAKAAAVITRLAVQPVAKDTDVGLQFGTLCVSALPALSAKPGAPPTVPPIVVEATEEIEAAENESRILHKFEGRVALRGAVIRLPERIVPSTAEKPATIIDGQHSTRLSFTDADALFYLPLLGRTPISSADAIVPIGPQSSEVSSAVIDLGRARLSILRPHDLLALKFRFSGLELVAAWPPVPDKTAELLPRGGRSPGRPFVRAANSLATQRDERPMLVVEFPPQHVVERAYFKQIPRTPYLPELTAVEKSNMQRMSELKRALKGPKQWNWSALPPGEVPTRLRWRNWVAELLEKCGAKPGDAGETTRELRMALRKEIQLLAKWPSQRLFEQSTARVPQTADRFQELFISGLDELFADSSEKMPEEQRLYVGADFLDPDARRVANDVIRKLQAEENQNQLDLEPTPKDALPVVKDIPQGDWKAIFQPFVDPKQIPPAQEQANWPRLTTADDPAFKRYDELANEVEFARERRDRDYAAFRAVYRRLARERGLKKWPEYFGAKWFADLLAKIPGLSGFKKALLDALPSQDDETIDPVVCARLSGPSRVAFRIDCDDYEPDRPGGRIPFTLEGLTNWGGMDMAVVRRAERLMEPLPGTTRLPPRWGRRAVNDDRAILHFQGFTSSERWTALTTEPYTHAPASAAVTARHRLAEVYASSAKEPDAFETAIELPFRLFLSPAQDATWVTSAPRVRRDAGLPDDLDTFRELWTARLSGQGENAGVRAVWSPDYRPEALLSIGAPGAPPMGAHAPWALPRSYGLRQIGDDNIEQFRTGLEAFDRHELVILSSVHGLPVLGRRAPSGDIAPDADQIEPPQGFRLQGVLLEQQEDRKLDMTAIYRPKSLSVNELSLSALGGNLDIDAGFQPPASARDAESRRNLFDALSVERWRQRTVLGRDIVVEVVYKGFLFPLGHRASLVKLTERRFVSLNGSPSAVLMQRLFLRVGKPEKRFPAEGQANRARRWPCERITILTRQTPDLVDARSDNPKDISNPINARDPERKDGFYVTRRGRIALKTKSGQRGTGICLWPRTSAREGAEVWFEMQIGDEAVPVHMPLIFVDNIAANDEDTIEALVEYYNRQVKYDSNTSPTRRLMRNGQPVVMAPEYKVADTTFQTQWWQVAAEGRERTLPSQSTATIALDNRLYTRDSFMEGQDQPPFYPLVDVAYCRLKSVERFTGSGPLWAKVIFDGEYVANGFIDAGRQDKPRAEQTEIYLRILKSASGDDNVALDFEERGDLGGGVARPTMDIVALSRSLGPINGGEQSPTKDAPATSTPEEPNALSVINARVQRLENSVNVVPKGKFLGIMELKDLVELVLGVKLHPKLTEVIEYGSATLVGAAGQAVAGGAASDIRSALTKSIIAPALDAVIEVRKAWEGLAQRQLKLPSGQEAPSLEQIYPQIGADVKALEDLLAGAQTPTLSDADFFGSLSAIHEAARRLIRAIEAITRDPLAAAASAQVKLFERLFTPVEAVRNAVKDFDTFNQVAANLPQIVTIAASEAMKAELRARVPDAVVDKVTVFKAIGNAVARCLPALRQWQLEKVIALPSALASALQTEIDALPVGTQPRVALEDITKVIQQLADRIDEVHNEASKVRKDIEDYVKQDPGLRELANKITERVSRAEKNAIDMALAALLSKQVATSLRVAAETDAALKAIPSPPFDQDKLNRFLNTITPVLSLVLDVNKAKIAADLFVTSICGKMKDALSAALAAILPPLLAADKTAFDIDASCQADLENRQLKDSCTTAPGSVTKLYDALLAAKEKLNDIPGTGPQQGDKFGAVGARLLAAIGRVGLAQKDLATAISQFPTGACGSPPHDLHEKLRNVSDSHRDMVVAARAFFETTSQITADYLLAGIIAKLPNFDAAFDKVAGSIDAVLTEFSSLTVYAGAGVTAQFRSAFEALAQSIEPALPGTAAALRDFVSKQSDRTELDSRRTALTGAADHVKQTADALKADATNVNAAAMKEALASAAREFLLMGETARAHLQNALATDLYNILADASSRIDQLIGPLASALGPVGSTAFDQLDMAYAVVVDSRKQLEGLVATQTSPAISNILDIMARTLGAGTDKRFLFQVFAKEDTTHANELLIMEQTLVHDVAVGLRSADATAQRRAVAKLDELLKAWHRPAIVELLRRFSEINSSFLRATLVEALDLRALRHELERIARELVPSKASLSYDFSTPVREFSLPGVGKVFLPVEGTRLDIKMRASIDLLAPMMPDARIDGHMGPFGIQLFGNFDVVILNFRGLDFRTGGGRSQGFDVRFGDFVIGSKAKFLKQLEPYISPKAGLPPVRMMKDKPGIEATYGVNLGSFGVGTLSFSNVTLNAGARLPFGAREEAEFLVSIGRPDAPFLISSTIFGGGGYLALLANGKGFIGVETSFDYGGVFTFGFGPLSGTGQITLGVYFRAARGEAARLGMNFMARGAANIACFSISTSLFVRLTYANGKMDGQATYTFSFSIGVHDIEFRIDVYVNQGSSAGQGSPTAFLDLPGIPPLTQFADAGPSLGSLSDAGPRVFIAEAGGRTGVHCKAEVPKKILRVRAPAQKTNWKGYRALFADDIDPVVKI